MDRLAEIRRRWTNHEDTPADVAWLLDIADAARELVGRIDLEGHQGDCCDRHGGYWLPEGDYIHAPDCPWLRARALLEGEGKKENSDERPSRV